MLPGVNGINLSFAKSCDNPRSGRHAGMIMPADGQEAGKGRKVVRSRIRGATSLRPAATLTYGSGPYRVHAKLGPGPASLPIPDATLRPQSADPEEQPGAAPVRLSAAEEGELIGLLRTIAALSDAKEAAESREPERAAPPPSAPIAAALPRRADPGRQAGSRRPLKPIALASIVFLGAGILPAPRFDFSGATLAAGETASSAIINIRETEGLDRAGLAAQLSATHDEPVPTFMAADAVSATGDGPTAVRAMPDDRPPAETAVSDLGRDAGASLAAQADLASQAEPAAAIAPSPAASPAGDARVETPGKVTPRYLLQLGAYHSESNARKDCAAFSSFAEVTVVSGGTNSKWFFCRTEEPRSRDEATSLVKVIKEARRDVAPLLVGSP